ncbi:dihydrofolate reductase family protein [Rhodococcus sp. ARC_M6]|uniref:dihydrofolate reductase family protein n=1 Tax=Rhodococcus sp. ARC_M6 TaxID=2928852 RepID=UPI001FB39E1C|nr:dihydrofolate reductase family protein [Rhodococcus sp. ARC_M6]MCJ0903356.1 dihydrofolate reductase family protein [Rhodococcus sp. ARC_M6]
MRNLSVTNSVTLDGVMQAPGGPEEDRRCGFEHGGWAAPFSDLVMARKMGEGIAAKSDLLFGRRTYEQFASYWPFQNDNPFTEVLDNTRKYVASRTLTEPLPWKNSTLLYGDAGDTVAALKEAPGPNVVILGSGELISALARRRLIDTYILLIHPLVLGTGRKLFPDGSALAQFTLTESVSTTTGVIIATYQLV